MFPMRGRRYVMLAVLVTVLLYVFYISSEPERGAYLKEYLQNNPDKEKEKEKEKPPPPPVRYLKEPDWTPPPVKDPFPLLAPVGAKPPPIPEWNKPRKDMHKEYDLSYAPPLFIGFTRTYPLLLQAVVSYITAGWPPEQIFVFENTGVGYANTNGGLSLQNPYYLDHEAMRKLGVNVIVVPVLMNFAQLQNYFVWISHGKAWPYYFWSHMDVLALSYEDGFDGVTPKAGEPGYKTLYELCLQELARVTKSDERWADKFFAYDHLTLVNREAYEDVGGWDTFIPYYMTDCDMHSRLLMNNWTQLDVHAGVITDVSAVLDDLQALYRVEGIEPTFTDPNPSPPGKDEEKKRRKREEPDATNAAASQEGGEGEGKDKAAEAPPRSDKMEASLAYWRKLQDTANNMFHYKHRTGGGGRNSWQTGQRGGQGEPFYYPQIGRAHV